MAWGMGVGRSRTLAGKFLDKEGITQTQFQKKSGLGEATLTRMCSDLDYRPSEMTKRRFVNTLNVMGYDVQVSDLW